MWSSGQDVFGKRLGSAHALSIGSLAMKDNVDPGRRKVTVLFKDPTLDTSPGSGLDPVANGAFLQVYNPQSGDAACFNLPASGWTSTGGPAAPAFLYRDSVYAHGPCNKVLIRHGRRLRAVCHGRVQPIPYTLDEPTQGAVAVRFGSGTVDYCSEFGSPVLMDEPGKFVLKPHVGPPSTGVICAAPPPGCP